jgi:hypothetical protein
MVTYKYLNLSIKYGLGVLPLHHRGYSDSPSPANPLKPPAAIPRIQLVAHLGKVDYAGRPDRMAERNGASARVHPGVVVRVLEVPG